MMIASYLGITPPESLSRIRKDLSKQNFTPY